MLTGLPEGFRLHSKERNFGVWGAASVLVYSALHNDTDGMVFDSRKYRHPKGEHWWRIPVLREYLPQYEWAMWVDADTIVNDFAIDLDELVRSVSDETILIVRVVHIPGISDDLNNGVFMIRNHPEAFELLRDWDTMPNSNGGYFDQSDLITILNYDKRLAKSHRKAPKGDRFWKRTKFQDRSGLLLQHYSAKCNDYRPGERAFISHYPGACTPDWTWARTEFCKAFSRTAVMRAEIARNPRAHGSVSPQEVAGVAWAVEQCTNREELDDLRNRVNALERTR